jgi:hypothetical protein
MTSKEAIIKAITLLKTNYQNALKDYDKEDLQMMINAWAEFFKDTTEQEFNKAIRNVINKSDYFPTISQIKKEIANEKVSNIASGEEEWEQVLRTIHRYGSYRQQEALEHMKPYTAYIVNLIGYQNICMSSDNTWNRKEFIAEYEQLKDKEQELLMTGNTNNLKMLTNTKL